ncbi:orotidine-5'-phosphate decarboxylase [candidate division WOR-3 bacterium]|nr:orotidine-5'-phosphate decarboxylase [candidate division WOR-3 bacterium]
MIEFIFPLDFDGAEEALLWEEKLEDAADVYKIGLQLFSREGPALVADMVSRKRSVFLDLKIHDIPNTAKKAAQAASFLGVKYLTAHASGGGEMIKAVSEALRGSMTKLLAVTVLTSIDETSFRECYSMESNIEDHVLKLAQAAEESGADGVVCSVREASLIRKSLGDRFLIITPGIRISDKKDDQNRTSGPEDAKRAKVNGIVMGRPVVQSPDPREFVLKIKEYLNEN